MAERKRAVIFANGNIPGPEKLRAFLRPGDWLVAADGGLRHLKILGLKPTLLIGDLDSVSPEDAARLQAEGVRVDRFPVEKDETDLELALKTVVSEGFRTVLVAGALGGRMDQSLGNIFLLLDPAYRDCDVRLEDGVEEAFAIRETAEIQGAAGDTVSLLPFAGPAVGIRTEGLRYPLNNETLFLEHTRGISNVMQAGAARVSLESGLLLCIHTRLE